jgi:hypothetical protein
MIAYNPCPDCVSKRFSYEKSRVFSVFIGKYRQFFNTMNNAVQSIFTIFIGENEGF